LRSIGVNTAAPQARTSRLDLERTGVDAVVRASPHYYNTDAELDRLAEGVADLVGVAHGSR
jgi:selenocysteine lyase/cysteine desulfurase